MFFLSHIYSGKLENAYKAYFPTKNIISRASQNGVCISAMIEYDKMLTNIPQNVLKKILSLESIFTFS